MASYYHMYYGTRSQVSKNLCSPLPFVSEVGMKYNFNLEDLDAITCAYPNEEKLILELCKDPTYQEYFTSFREEHLLIAHSYGGKVHIDDPIYQQPFLKNCAIYVQEQKKKKLKDDVILLPNTEKLEAISRRLKALVLNEEADYFLHTKDMDYMLKKELQAYVFAQTRNDMSFSWAQELDDIERNISYYLRHYKVLRKFLASEQKHKSQKQIPESTDDGQLSLFSFPVPTTEAISLADYPDIENEELAYWYEEGGVAAIMEHMGADDIYSCSTADLIQTGVFPPDYQEEERAIKKPYEKKR